MSGFSVSVEHHQQLIIAQLGSQKPGDKYSESRGLSAQIVLRIPVSVAPILAPDQ